MTISPTEEKYVDVTSTTCHAVWLRIILNDIKHEYKDPTLIFCDNNSIIAISKNHTFHCKSRHIDTHYHYIHELVNNG